MTFAEKLIKLIGEDSRARIARKAALQPSILNNYVNRGSAPMARAALQLARALSVPLDWLIDDAQEWPPPDPKEKLSPSLLSDRDLMMEVARRDRLEIIHFLECLDKAEKVDWEAIHREVSTFRDDEPIPPTSREVMGLVVTLFYIHNQLLGRYQPEYFARHNHAAMPGADRPLELFDTGNLLQRWANLIQKQGYQEALARFLPFVPPDNRQTFERVQFRDHSPFEIPKAPAKQKREGPPCNPAQPQP